jgi:hypothetical protein
MAKASLITQVGANYLEKADNLSDVASKDTAKLNLEVPNVGTAANEVPVNGMLGNLAFQSSAGVIVDDLTVDGELIAAVGKPMPVNGPTMRFDGASHVEFADNNAFSFTNGTDDTPFTVSAWVKASKLDAGAIVAKQSVSSNGEWAVTLSTSGTPLLTLYNLGNTANRIFGYLGNPLSLHTWTHIVFTYSGGKSATNVNAYQNGKLNSGTQADAGTYTGMTNGGSLVQIGRSSSAGFFDGEIRDVKLFNKELSAAEVREVYSNGQLPNSFSESTGGADGGIYTSDFSAGVDGTTAVNGVLAGNVDSVGPSGDLRDDNLRFTANAGSSYKKIQKDNITTVGKRNRATFDYFIPSGQSNIDGFAVSDGGVFISSAATRTLGTWTRFEVEYVGSYNDLHIWPTDGTATTYDDTGGDDVMYVRNVKVTQIGSVLDARAENYNQSAGKLLDVSGNDFVGTQSGGVTLLTPRSHLSAGTLDLTNLPTTASGLSAGEVYNDSGILKIV